MTLDDAIRSAVVRSLIKHKFNRSRAARELGVCVRSLRNYINRYQLKDIGDDEVGGVVDAAVKDLRTSFRALTVVLTEPQNSLSRQEMKFIRESIRKAAVLLRVAESSDAAGGKPVERSSERIGQATVN